MFFENEALYLASEKDQRIAMENKVVIKKDFLTNELFTHLSNGCKYNFKKNDGKKIEEMIESALDDERLRFEREKIKEKNKTRKIRFKLDIKEKKLKQLELELKVKLKELEKMMLQNKKNKNSL